MGEMADDIIEGFSCCLCGVYFEDEHGYPVVCKDCWTHLDKKERTQYQRARNEEI